MVDGGVILQRRHDFMTIPQVGGVFKVDAFNLRGPMDPGPARLRNYFIDGLDGLGRRARAGGRRPRGAPLP